MRNGKFTALIAVREGSNRVLRKNIRDFAGSSLLKLKIEQALAVDGIDEVVVSSDSNEMLNLADSLKVKTISLSIATLLAFWDGEKPPVVTCGFLLQVNRLFSGLNNPSLQEKSPLPLEKKVSSSQPARAVPSWLKVRPLARLELGIAGIVQSA